MKSLLTRYIAFCFFVAIIGSACDSNEPEEVRVPLGTFQVIIDGEPWQADIAIANSFDMPVFRGEDEVDSMRLFIGGFALDGEGRFGRNMAIGVSDPEVGRYSQELGANLTFFNPEADTTIIYYSTEMELILSELTEEEVRGTFRATIAELSLVDATNNRRQKELTEGVFALPVEDFLVDDSLFFPTPRF